MNSVFSSVVALLCLGVSSVASADVPPVFFEGDCFPEELGFERTTHHRPDRWIDDGWFVQEIDVGDGDGSPYSGELDTYLYDLGPYTGEPFYVEWRMITDAPNEEIDAHSGGANMILVGGDVAYRCSMASGLAGILRGYPYPIQYFEIEPGVPHTYRLEVYGAEYFSLSIDEVIVDDGLPEADWPTPDALISFGSRYYLNEHITQWDYIRFGSIPEPASGLMLLAGSLFVQRRHPRFAAPRRT